MNKVILNDVIEVISGGTPKTSIKEYWENGIIGWLSINDFNDDNRRVFRSEKKITEKGLKESSTKLLNIDDVIISARGTVGVLAQIGFPMAFNQSCFGLRGKEKLMDNTYLYYALKNYVSNIQKRGQGSVFNTINLDSFKLMEIDIESFQTQLKIAAVLSALDDKIELNNQINTVLEAMAKTLYDYWFVQFDFPDENGKPYQSSGGKMVFNETLKREIPVGWEVKSFDGLIDFTRGVSYTSATMNESVGIPMINLKSFNLNGTYRIDGLKYFTGKLNENRIISKSDLLIAITDVTRDAEIIGKAILVPEFSENAVCSCDVSRVDILNESFSKNYLRYLFNSSYYHNYIKHYASGTLVLHLDLKGILWYTDVIPPKELQLKFDHFVNKIDAKIQTNLQQNKELAQLRDWLLPMLMNGQVRVGSGEYEMEEGGLGMVGEGKREYKKI